MSMVILILRLSVLIYIRPIGIFLWQELQNVGYLLIQRGLPESNLVMRGFGSQRPVTDNASSEGRALNRRVEITIAELTTNTPSSNGYSKSDSLKNIKQ